MRFPSGGRGRLAALALGAFSVLASSVLRAQDDAEKVDEAQAKQALTLAEKIEREVEKFRELKFQAPVRKGVESEAESKRHMLEEANKPENRDELEKSGRVGKAFGLLPEDYDMAKAADYLAEAAGAYDYETKKLVLVQQKVEKGHLGIDTDTIAHELEHALQDQTFDLARWDTLLDSHVDRSEAWTCIVEGEATFVAHAWTFTQMGKPIPELPVPDEPEPSEVPAWIVRNFTMPYEQGARFVQKVHAKGGWDAVNKLFRDPPSTTQQVLHPQRFFDRREPAEILMPSLRKVVGGKAKEVDRSTMGEWNVRILLETLGTAPRTAKAVAAGWHGDRYQLIELEDGSVALVWLTIWDDEAKAKAFVEAYSPGLEALHKTRGHGTSKLEPSGAAVLLVDCANGDARLAEKLARKAWASVLRGSHLEPLPGLLEKPDAKEF